MNEKSYFINASGNNIRYLENEAIQTLYTMTKEPSSDTNELATLHALSFIEKKPSDFTFEFLLENFGNLTSNTNDIRNT